MIGALGNDLGASEGNSQGFGFRVYFGCRVVFRGLGVRKGVGFRVEGLGSLGFWGFRARGFLRVSHLVHLPSRCLRAQAF